MGIFKKDELLLDFKGVKTEDMSSTIPYMNKLNTDAKMLVNQLDPNTANVNRKGLVLFNESEQYDLYKLFEKSTTLNNNDNNFSETSPFISSDVYNQLLNKLKNKQSGGKSKQSRSRNEDKDEDFEDESSTTSSEESESDKKKKHIKKMFKKESDEIDLEVEEVEEDEVLSEMSAGSYVSSSAHTDGTNSNTNSDSDNNTSSFVTSASASVSVKNHRNRHHNVSDSVNTSDINIISVE